MEVYFGWVGVSRHLLWVVGGGRKCILGEWEWVEVYLGGWVCGGVVGDIFWVGGSELG